VALPAPKSVAAPCDPPVVNEIACENKKPGNSAANGRFRALAVQSYTTGIDTECRGDLITNHKSFLSVGHDEYWSGGQRANVEAARFWRNTRVASLNGRAINHPRLGNPRLRTGPVAGQWLPTSRPDPAFYDNQKRVDYLQDHGSTYALGTATHHLTMYRAPSGALVFGAGTVQWAWSLDNNRI
jgi:hypothetical protein